MSHKEGMAWYSSRPMPYLKVWKPTQRLVLRERIPHYMALHVRQLMKLEGRGRDVEVGVNISVAKRRIHSSDFVKKQEAKNLLTLSFQ